jgi:hypothetical protein
MVSRLAENHLVVAGPKKRKRFHGCPMTIAPRLGTWSDTSMNMNVALTLPDYWEITFAWRKSILKLDINGFV